MDNKIAAILVVVLLSILGVVGDYFLKLASTEERFIWNRWLPPNAVGTTRTNKAMADHLHRDGLFGVTLGVLD